MRAKYSHGVWERFAHTFEKSFFSQKSRSVNYSFCHPALAICVPREISKLWKNGLCAILKKCTHFRLFWKPISDYLGKTGCFFKLFWKNTPFFKIVGNIHSFFKLFWKKHTIFQNSWKFQGHFSNYLEKAPSFSKLSEIWQGHFSNYVEKNTQFFKIVGNQTRSFFKICLKKRSIFHNSRQLDKFIFQNCK